MGIPPSEIYYISDELTAWCFNRAVQSFGVALENRLHEVGEKAKNKAQAKRKSQQELEKWLSSGDTKASRGRFRDPMTTIQGR